MRRIVLESPRVFSLQEAERPEPRPNAALVKIRKVGICGSDMHLYQKGFIGNISVEGPFVIGHECVGEVIEAGEGAPRDLVGSRVAIEPAISCNQCQWCLFPFMALLCGVAARRKR
ncbi:MAG: alcohol dehydrogenase catalytic domain-containing protein [Deltaproteobacteria bacterium]|nr:alcohol dehydrogenase catalytic domain-containing protein [Deltaproteobacteria bacterium]MBW2086175.1 alcohol dehydrogenase catalytic domain-containing protein [Deltaproteobacteria bacterium]